ncbi:Wadjet anti-phage system protein JetD domain-containing protein [Marinobacterium litorale]|uniref:Wadjet anti-phage system protein JetD domain-containing protein n=1 Tax=Marinobacterium litorale TaxID=404770 RepID=UPI0004234F4F|nr:Wadjet anti-phage system protein JetD domain-containing protein [Marinobacterium litorale]
MKSPSELSRRLAKQWHRSALRVERLLSPDSWPLTLSIGKPTGAEFSAKTTAVYEHVRRWQAVQVGTVEWQSVKYRAGAEAISIPVCWHIHTPSEWVSVAADATVTEEYGVLEYLVTHVEPIYRELLIRDRSLWRNKERQEVLDTARLADRLSPGCAHGRPLRLLAGLGVDTKFFERNGTLLTKLLDERFEGAASEQGLSNFLDAFDENEHWVLVAPLDQGLLPFKRLRLTTSELAETPLPSSRVLVVENERCIHQLPQLADTIAVLGAGLDLQWLQAAHFEGKQVGYWGDMDTWGLLMLSRARQYQPSLSALLMSPALFQLYEKDRAVQEPICAQGNLPVGLTDEEGAFYKYLLRQNKGRLEQEFLPVNEVHRELRRWANEAWRGSPV